MASSTKTILVDYDDGMYDKYPVYQATKIPAGALVMLNATGYAVNAADTTGCQVIGVAVDEADNSSGSSADIKVKVRIKGRHKFLLSSAAITDIGTIATALYNNEVSRVGTTTYDLPVGMITQIESTTHAWVDLGVRANEV